jgi:molybdate transport system substrate-binding protein
MLPDGHIVRQPLMLARTSFPARFVAAARLLAALACLLAAFGGCGGIVRAEASPVIAAAADLQYALAEVAETFAQQSGSAVRLTFGSSGNFARQLRQGAPFELFFSADEAYVLALAKEGVLRDEGVLYAYGRLALVVPSASPLAADGSLQDLKTALADGRLGKLAIANPEHAPYGKRAREALSHAGLWPLLERKLVLGENVAQAAQFALSGNAQAGIVAYALALSPQLGARARIALIAESWHEPLRQRMALMPQAGPVAQSFYAFVQTAPARAILRRHGFTLPGEAEASQ